MQERVRRSGGLEVAEGVLARVGDVEEPRQNVGLASGCMLRAARPLADVGQAAGNSPILILVLLVDAAHQGGGWRQDLIDEDEDGLLRGELDPLPDDVDELPDGEICWYEVLLLVDSRDIALLDLFADDLEGEHVSDVMWEMVLNCAGGEGADRLRRASPRAVEHAGSPPATGGQRTGMRSEYFWRMRSASALRFSKGCSSLNLLRILAVVKMIRSVLVCAGGAGAGALFNEACDKR